jgi:hypothetical protein
MIPTLSHECSQFLADSKGNPILKHLPIPGQGFRRVKVRQKKHIDQFSSTFSEAFYQERKNLLRRAVIARNESTLLPAPPGMEPFYVFPRNGFRFMYCQNPEVTTEAYKDILTQMIKAVGTESGLSVFHEVVKYQYTFSDLDCGIMSGAEVIFYQIPWYYAIRKSLVLDYQKFIYT